MPSYGKYAAVAAVLASSVSAVPQPHLRSVLVSRDSVVPASIPQNDNVTAETRKAEVSETANGWVYGPSLIGEAAPFPNGTLGNERSAYDYSVWEKDRAEIDALVEKDVAQMTAAIEANGGLNSLEDYVNVVYGPDAWKNTNPLQTTGGIMTNYTQDLLFSMERLSYNPYPMELVQPNDSLPFELPEAEEIAGASLADLQSQGLLFVVDHSDQIDYEKTSIDPPRDGAACTAYFYISPESGDFLPLAIKTNVGSDLIYTPLDDPTDWLFGKMLFNVNDFFHQQMFHLTVTHDVSEAVHQAAIRTLSANHPIMRVLERLMLQGYSARIVGEELCFNPGGHWDQLFYVDNVGCRQYVTQAWPVKAAYQSSYLTTDFAGRGLISDDLSYKFKSFPFFEDANRIREIYSTFFTSFIDSYYASDSDVADDWEVAAWFAEAPSAGVVDFPSSDSAITKETLVDVLTHFAFIISVVHHGLNGGDPMGGKATLPFHLQALHAPLPTEKGLTDLLPFMPDAKQTIHYIGFLATFNRPFYPTSERTVEWALAGGQTGLLEGLNEETREAAEVFKQGMEEMSAEVQGRSFDADGLSLGMPFIYRTLDPGYIPFFCAV